jgi:hypothetical protein
MFGISFSMTDATRTAKNIPEATYNSNCLNNYVVSLTFKVKPLYLTNKQKPEERPTETERDSNYVAV